MNRIELLDERTCNQIAAGEVVERPSSVVKELVENSLDAGARSITVRLEEAGTRLIEVTDDGWGMSQGDLRLSVERHATSKLRSIADLTRLGTLGFRGEALPSIAAVASLEIVTREKGAVSGNMLRLQPGDGPTLEKAGAPTGTTVTVRNLFATIPARKKHLRSAATEFNHISRVCYALALGHPAVSLRLIHNDRGVLHTPGDGSLASALVALFGADFARNLVHLPPTGVLSDGYTGRPSQARSNRDQQYVFVNRRYVRSPLVSGAVEEAYRGLLTVHRYPVFFVFLDLDGGDVDVNVHPSKERARFVDQAGVRRTIVQSVRRTLVEADHIPDVRREGREGGRAPTPRWHSRGAAETGSVPNYSQLDSFREKQDEYRSYPGWPDFSRREPDGIQDEPDDAGAPTPGDRNERPALQSLRALTQVSNSYIVAEGSDGLYIVDQHAAHERLVYEQFLQAVASEDPNRQYLAAPAPLRLTPGESALLAEHADWIGGWGFEWDEFGSGRILVRAVPAVFGEEARADALLELLDRLDDYQGARGAALLEQQRATVILGACKAAVKAHDDLDPAEQQALLGDLARADAPYTCPHGRPTVLRLSYEQLERFFKRTM